MRTKRIMLVLLIAAFVLGLGSLATVTQAAPPQQASTVSIKVLNPQGTIPVVNKFAPRLSTLDGKTVALWLELSNTFEFQEGGKAMFSDIAVSLTKQFPNVKILTPDKFPDAPELKSADAIIAAKPDAAILGVGG